MEAGTAIDSRFHTAMIRTPRFGLRPLLQSNDPTSTGGQEFPAASGKAAAHPLDAVTGGVFSAATSGERAARLRAWLATEPEVAVMQEVFRDLSTRDKGAAKPLREKLDEIKRSRGQEALAAEWQARAEQLLQASRLNIADAMAWQRDAAKAGAPLSKEPLATTRTQLAERIKVIEDLQTQVQIQREAAVLLAQRIETLSTKSWKEAEEAETGLQTDVADWRQQAQTLQQDASWPSVDPKYAGQLESAVDQLQLVVQAFEDALQQVRAAAADNSAALPSVPVWADEIRSLRGEAPEAAAEPAEDPAVAAERQQALAQRRAEAETVVTAAVKALEAELVSGHSKASVAAAQALRQAHKEHRKAISPELEGQVHAVLASAGELEGWQRWRADQLRQELVQKAEALIDRPAAEPVVEAAADTPAAETAVAEAPAAETPAAEASASESPAAETQAADADTAPAAEPAAVELAESTEAAAEPAAAQDEGAKAAPAEATQPAAAPVVARPARRQSDKQAAKGERPLPTSKLSPRKLQETLRQLREQWKQTDQGGVPNHALWKRFDQACNEAYRIVEAWLSTMKEHAAQQKTLRLTLLEDVKAWTARHQEQVDAGRADWKAVHRDLLAFSRRWREAGHVSEKVFAELQPRWKAAMAEAGAHIDAAQKASIQLRHAMIDEAKELGAAPSLRIDAIKALQQRWQQEAQTVPLERKHEQKLWDAFRKPLDEAFQRKHEQRGQQQAEMNERDRAVFDASKALEAANATGDAQAIRAAMQALNDAIRGQQEQQSADAAAAAEASAAEAAPETPLEEGAMRPPAPSALQHKPAVAVRGDDRPQQQRPGATRQRDERGDRRDSRERGRDGRRDGRFGDRFGDRPERGPRAPRLGDAAFRAQRDAVEHAQAALRKLAEQAHGETLTQLLSAWEKRQPDAIPVASELGRRVSGSQRNAWVAALGQGAASGRESEALLRLEMAAEVPTPADQLNARRALQLQLLTRRNDPSPQETWHEDVASVLAAPHDAANAKRLQHALRALLKG